MSIRPGILVLILLVNRTPFRFVFCAFNILRMEPIRKTPRGPPVGYVIDGHRYFTVAEAVRIIGREFICFQTLTYYALGIYQPDGGPALM